MHPCLTVGNIPAYAGKTLRSTAHLDRAGEHPRVCGENSRGRIRHHRGRGTSPRMRGKLNNLGIAGVAGWNIPAYAGKTHRPYIGRSYLSEHPRVCGENQQTGYGDCESSGTSPRMRGKHVIDVALDAAHGNIPAYAGKTIWLAFSAPSITEHPRVCGENSISDAELLEQLGTSPRMRGKQHFRNLTQVRLGNIPAYAGKTTPKHHSMRSRAEHPRVCGENSLGTLF